MSIAFVGSPDTEETVKSYHTKLERAFEILGGLQQPCHCYSSEQHVDCLLKEQAAQCELEQLAAEIAMALTGKKAVFE